MRFVYGNRVLLCLLSISCLIQADRAERKVVRTAITQEIKQKTAESEVFTLDAAELSLEDWGITEPVLIQDCDNVDSHLDAAAQKHIRHLVMQVKKLGIKSAINAVNALTLSPSVDPLTFYIIDANNRIVADSSYKRYIGKGLNETPSPFVSEDILIALLSEHRTEGWAFYSWLGIPKRAYTYFIRTPSDPDSKFYIIGASYPCKRGIS